METTQNPQNLFLKSAKAKNIGESRTAQFRETLRIDSTSDWEGVEVDGYTIYGKLDTVGSRYLLQKDEQFYYGVVKDLTIGATGSNGGHNMVPIEDIHIDIVKMGDIEYDPSIFIPIKSNTPMDGIFSKKGGTMPATNYIIIGDPGIGKSTVSIEYAAKLKVANPDKKILFISGEMTRVDMYEYLERFPDWKELPTVFMSELTESRYKESIEELFNQGWDFIVGDSFAEIVEAVQEDYNTYSNGKMSSKGSEKWLIDLMVDNNLGKNRLRKHTAHLIIQQVTKGGKFVGSNKLKHNTTGMIELRYTKSGERKIIVEKNRRGTQYGNLDLHFQFPETGDEPIHFDIERLMREQEIYNTVNSEREDLLRDERAVNKLFGIEIEDESEALV